jgi:hypothetical protein
MPHWSLTTAMDKTHTTGTNNSTIRTWATIMGVTRLMPDNTLDELVKNMWQISILRKGALVHNKNSDTAATGTRIAQAVLSWDPNDQNTIGPLPTSWRNDGPLIANKPTTKHRQ